jgi:SsrA-binding protein
MSKMSSKSSSLIVNRRARFDYDVQDKITAGLALSGREVRAVRSGRVSLRGAYVTVKDGELWLTNASFTLQPSDGGGDTTVDTSPRKLLVKKRELASLQAAKDRGHTIIPLSMTTRTRYIKLDIASAKGKKSYDKRETIKRRDVEREQNRAIKNA